MHRFVGGLVSNKLLAVSHVSSPKFYSPSQSQRCLDTFFLWAGKIVASKRGEGNANNGGSLCGQGRRESIEALLLLIQVTEVNGCLLPIGSFTACTVATVVHNQMGHLLVDVDVMSDCDAVIELETDVRVGEVAQHLHGTHEWDGQQAEISCLLSTCCSVINVVQGCENGHVHFQQLEDEQHHTQVREEQQHHHEQLARFLVQFQDEVRKIEKLQQV